MLFPPCYPDISTIQLNPDRFDSERKYFMKILKIGISNYRNLDEIEVCFHPNVNFIVGETNLGKTNLLSLLNTIFNWRSFLESDFSDPEKSIEIELQISLDNIEKGHFEDLFSPEESDKINISAIQNSPDDNIQFFHTETETSISPALLKRLNYIYYDSLRNPSNELTFDKRKGVGKFLNHLYAKFLEKNDIEDIDFINKHKLEGLLKFINECLGKIKSFKDFSISANADSDVRNLLARIICLKDDQDFNLQQSGYGIQYTSLICLTIFEKLMGRGLSRNKEYFEDEDGKKYASMILGLDEPEIHLHPYMQRSLIKYLMKIIDNKDSEFIELISNLFSLDGFLGQIIICTHSPSVTLSSYKQIIRLYKDEDDTLSVKNGPKIRLPKNLEKQLNKNMPYIKEAFFSKCVILVEGDTEVGAFPEFAATLGIDLDGNGISIIQAGSADSIPPLMKLLNKFGILNIGVMDKDKKNEKYVKIKNLYFTDKFDFEDDVVSTCFKMKKRDVLLGIIEGNDPKGKNRVIENEKLNSIIKKYDIELDKLEDNYDFTVSDPDIMYSVILAWLDINKSILLGKIIGETLDEDLIPKVFKEVLRRAERISSNA